MRNRALAAASVWSPAVQQAAFRALMQAFARPGDVRMLSHPALPLIPATLLDSATSLADAQMMMEAMDRDRMEAVLTTPALAHFVLVSGATAPDFTPALGTLESPELGATLLIVVKNLRDGQALTLSGPGISGSREIRLSGLSPAWLRAREDWNAAFPMGVDMLLMAECEVMALPRTTCIKGVESWVM